MQTLTALLTGRGASPAYAEAFTQSGELWEKWQPLFNHFTPKSPVQLDKDFARAQRMRHEDGATINPFDEVSEPSTAWGLDILPLPMSAQEWQFLELGVIQRATLLESVLKDVYSHQELLESGRIPPELLFANPNFLYPCHNIRPQGGRHLSFYAVDIYRDQNGNFTVWKDHASNPVGLGFALENRIVMSRLYPDFYHQTQIRRVAPFFQSFHRSLTRRAQLSKNEEGIVFFTPGPDSPAYFEHALLSRYLGYPLVEGQDLTVRNGRIFQRKLAGLEPVKAIFRHISDPASDPFALRSTSTEGVAGIIQVCREENIEIINPIGAGFIETPLLRTYLQKLSSYLLGENLILPQHQLTPCKDLSVPQPDFTYSNRIYLHALEQNRPPLAPEMLQQLSPEQLQEYLCAEPVQPSLSPALGKNGAYETPVKLRLFACATDNGFALMPGGLAITADSVETLFFGTPEQQRSKDIWVLSDEPVIPVTLMDDFDTIPEFRRGSDMPSRVADNILWLGRYLERAEVLIRQLRPAYELLLGEKRPEDVAELPFLINILRERNIIDPPPKIKKGRYDHLQEQLHLALFGRKERESVVVLLNRVREIAHSVRDRLSIDSFKTINRLENFVGHPAEDPQELLDRALFTLNSFSGLAMETMTREVGWRFLDMGRRLERAINLLSLLDTGIPLIEQEQSQTSLQVLLEICHSLMTYRGRYRSSFQLAPVLDLLLLDETNPKSLAFQLRLIAEHVEHLPRPGKIKFASLEEKLALEMLTTTRLFDLTNISLESISNEGILSDFFTRLETLLAEFSEQITAHYLSRIPATPHYAGISLHTPAL